MEGRQPLRRLRSVGRVRLVASAGVMAVFCCRALFVGQGVSWSTNSKQRVDFAYLSDHDLSLVVKGLSERFFELGDLHADPRDPVSARRQRSTRHLRRAIRQVRQPGLRTRSAHSPRWLSCKSTPDSLQWENALQRSHSLSRPAQTPPRLRIPVWARGAVGPALTLIVIPHR